MEGPDPLASFLWPAPLCGTPEKVTEDFREGASGSTAAARRRRSVDAKSYNKEPPQVIYSLNAEGKNLVPLMETLCDWGSAHFGIKPHLPRDATRF
jgi:HxlR-like helix-turn-helix